MVQSLTQQIESGQLASGDRLPAIRTLAKDFGISFSTARGAIARLERMGLVRSHQGSGTFVWRRKSPPINTDPATDWACLIADQRPHVVGELNVKLTRQLQINHVLPIELTWLPGTMKEQFGRVMRMWGNSPPRAVIQQGHDEDIDTAIEKHTDDRTTVVTMFRTTQWMPSHWHSVNPNYVEAYSMAARYLIEQGHKRIGIVAKPRILRGFWRHTHRKAWMPQTQGIVAAGHIMREAGLSHGLTIHYNNNISNDPSVIPTDETNIQGMMRWLSQPNRPTAVMGADFRMLGIKHAARRLGIRVGEDLHLIGIGGSLLSNESDYPTVSLSIEEIAKQAAELATSDPHELRGSARHIVVAPRLIDPTATTQSGE